MPASASSRNQTPFLLASPSRSKGLTQAHVLLMKQHMDKVVEFQMHKSHCQASHCKTCDQLNRERKEQKNLLLRHVAEVDDRA